MGGRVTLGLSAAICFMQAFFPRWTRLDISYLLSSWFCAPRELNHLDSIAGSLAPGLPGVLASRDCEKVRGKRENQFWLLVSWDFCLQDHHDMTRLLSWWLQLLFEGFLLISVIASGQPEQFFIIFPRLCPFP